MATDHIAIVEAGYDLEADGELWLRAVGESLLSAFPDALGVVAHYYDPMDLRASILDSMIYLGPD
ncbi:MAG: hypothetical protein V3V08_04090 [Nannocystaceae bacterium]